MPEELRSLGALSEVCEKPRGSEGVATKAAFLSEHEAHQCLFRQDSPLLVPGLPDLGETRRRAERSAEWRGCGRPASSGFSFSFHLNPNVTPPPASVQQTPGWEALCSILRMYPVSFLFFFLYSALHLLKFNLFNAKQDLERSVILKLV